MNDPLDLFGDAAGGLEKLLSKPKRYIGINVDAGEWRKVSEAVEAWARQEYASLPSEESFGLVKQTKAEFRDEYRRGLTQRLVDVTGGKIAHRDGKEDRFDFYVPVDAIVNPDEFLKAVATMNEGFWHSLLAKYSIPAETSNLRISVACEHGEIHVAADRNLVESDSADAMTGPVFYALVRVTRNHKDALKGEASIALDDHTVFELFGSEAYAQTALYLQDLMLKPVPSAGLQFLKKYEMKVDGRMTVQTKPAHVDGILKGLLAAANTAPVPLDQKVASIFASRHVVGHNPRFNESWLGFADYLLGRLENVTKEHYAQQSKERYRRETRLKLKMAPLTAEPASVEEAHKARGEVSVPLDEKWYAYLHSYLKEHGTPAQVARLEKSVTPATTTNPKGRKMQLWYEPAEVYNDPVAYRSIARLAKLGFAQGVSPLTMGNLFSRTRDVVENAYENPESSDVGGDPGHQSKLMFYLDMNDLSEVSRRERPTPKELVEAVFNMAATPFLAPKDRAEHISKLVRDYTLEVAILFSKVMPYEELRHFFETIDSVRKAPQEWRDRPLTEQFYGEIADSYLRKIGGPGTSFTG